MARLIDSRTTVEIDQVVAGLPVIEFIDDIPGEMLSAAVPRKMSGGARLDRTFEVIDWFEC